MLWCDILQYIVKRRDYWRSRGQASMNEPSREATSSHFPAKNGHIMVWHDNDILQNIVTPPSQKKMQLSFPKKSNNFNLFGNININVILYKFDQIWSESYILLVWIFGMERVLHCTSYTIQIPPLMSRRNGSGSCWMNYNCFWGIAS